MTINEAIGISISGVDLKTGEEVSAREEYRRAIEYLGGVDEVAKYIPFPISELKEAAKKDPFLNNTNLHEWDKAAGFDSESISCLCRGSVRFTGGGIWELYRTHGITSASCADGVCILKEAALMVIECEK